MKTSKFLCWISMMLLTVSIVLTSCEAENDDFVSEESLVTPDSISNSEYGPKAAASIVNEKVYRYYAGGSLSLHTYRTQSGTGSAIGTYEGVAFTTPVSSTSTGFDRNKYNVLYFMIHPQNKDFIMTTSGTEFWNLRRQGWKNVTRKYVLIQKSSGNGTVKLYRFYDTANSDHLFTKSYSEGVNAGLAYEGVVGWVK
ncbi:hypothetical protein [Aquimarina rubra]|uniref:DUF5648 domain-containing protein n=1 Tax=Aquimarina rubra TaxID=1920033 RepID=A0ABW5LAK1_9FLAO